MTEINKRPEYLPTFSQTAMLVKSDSDWKCECCGHPHDPESGYTLTVHHLDHNTKNDALWNLAALCQRCHLRHQKDNIFIQMLFSFLKNDYWLTPHLKGYIESNAKGVKPCLTEKHSP